MMDTNYCDSCGTNREDWNFCSVCGSERISPHEKTPFNYRIILIIHGIVATLMMLGIVPTLLALRNEETDMQFYGFIGVFALTLVFFVPPAGVFIGLWTKSNAIRVLYLGLSIIIVLISLPLAVFDHSIGAVIVLALFGYFIYTLHFDKNVKSLFLIKRYDPSRFQQNSSNTTH